MNINKVISIVNKYYTLAKRERERDALEKRAIDWLCTISYITINIKCAFSKIDNYKISASKYYTVYNNLPTYASRLSNENRFMRF